ncbi:hypothetical protein GCM10009609_02810 [Pseudonocardia aurantiaca]|uniref:Scr1 family TA system antitoxin-like transcriptional regulator n=1 Tax=Pseudonocardia aurantiaca TaxID=75290 RepID=A0ABW4FG64_9PSEU
MAPRGHRAGEAHRADPSRWCAQGAAEHVLPAPGDHLVERVEELGPRLLVRVIPFTHPGHPVLGTPSFHVLGFASTRLPDLVWLDMVTGVQFVDDPIAVHEHRLAHAGAEDAALDAVESVAMIKAAAQEFA